MNRLTLLFSICCCFCSSLAFACQCIPQPDFVNSVFPHDDHQGVDIIVEAVKTADVPAYGMEIDIINVFYGTETRNKVIVWGDPGNLCRTNVQFSFAVGDTLIFGLYETDLLGNINGTNYEQADDYMLSACGEYYIEVSNRMASGPFLCTIPDDPASCLIFDVPQVDIGTTLQRFMPAVNVQLKTILEAAYNPDLGAMKPILRSNDLIPTRQPFSTAPWNYVGSEQLLNLPSDVIDWVLVEAYAANDRNVLVSQAAGLLLGDGQIIGFDLDGNYLAEGLNFYGLVPDESYHFVVRHRNHLAIMSKEAIQVPNAQAFDFSRAANQSFGADQTKELALGVYAQYSGDFDADGIITVGDYNAFKNQASIINQYVNGDFNLDRAVSVIDLNLYQANSGKIGVTEIRY